MQNCISERLKIAGHEIIPQLPVLEDSRSDTPAHLEKEETMKTQMWSYNLQTSIIPVKKCTETTDAPAGILHGLPK